MEKEENRVTETTLTSVGKRFVFYVEGNGEVFINPKDIEFAKNLTGEITPIRVIATIDTVQAISE